MCSRSSPERARLGEEVVQQRTPPAVAVLGGIPAAAQNVAGPPQHVLQPVPAASLPPPLFDPAAEMEQPKANTQAANEQQTTTMAWRNCNTKEPEEKSNLDSSMEAVQKQILPMDAGNSQNFSDRLSACNTGEVRKGQDLLYKCSTEKTSLDHGETEMAEGTGHSQDRTPNPGVAFKMEKGPQASEKAYLEHTSKTDQEEVHEAKHTTRKSICFPPIQSNSAVSIAHEATDSDHKQPTDTEQFQTGPSLHSAQSSLLLESNVQKIVQQPLTATIITANMEMLKKSSSASSSMDDVTKEKHVADEGSIGSSSTASEKEWDNSDTVGFSAKQGESVCRLPILTGNGNNTQNNTDKDGGCSYEKQSSVAAVSTPNAAFAQKTLDPCHHAQNTHGTQANQLSHGCMNCSGTPKSVLTGNMSSSTGGMDIKTVSLHGTEVCYDISIKEPKVLGDETCTHDIQAPKVTEGAHVVACNASYGIAKQNDCAKSMQMSPYQDHQPDGSYVLLHKNKCTDSEGLDSNEPCLSPVIQQGQEAVLVDQKLPQVHCLNDGISVSDNINVDVKNDEVSDDFSALHAVETKDLIDVGILVQPGIEDTWLVVSDHSSLIDGQCQSTEDAEMVDVSTEVVGHSTESQTSVAVYECTVPCFSPDAIHEAAKLLLPEEVVEVPADKHLFEPLSETLTQDLDDSSHPPDVIASQKVLSSTTSANICMQNMVSKPTFCSNAESTINVDSALISNPSTVQVEQVKSTENISGMSQISLSSSVIDPKLLILKRGETILKEPPMLTLVSRNQSPSGSPNECLDRVSVECLSEYDLTTDIVTEKAAKPPLSFHVINAPCNITCSSAKDESKKQTLIESDHCLPLEKQIPEDEPLLNSSTSAQTRTLYTARLPSRSGSMCSTITDQSEGPANQEVEEQHSPVQHLTEVKDAPDSTLEQLDPSVGESSEGEADGSLEAQPSESTAIPSPPQNKVRIMVFHALLFNIKYTFKAYLLSLHFFVLII